MNRTLSVVSFLSIVSTTGLSSPTSAQADRLWAEPRLGWAMPTRDLGRTDVIGNAGFGDFQQVDEGVVVGLGIGASLGPRWAFRVTADRLIGASVAGEWRCAPFVACPAALLPLDAELSRWSVAADAIYRPRTHLPLDPVLFAGAGIQQSELSWGPPEADITLPALAFKEREPIYHAGAGLERRVGDATLFGTLQVTSSRFGGGLYESIEGVMPEERQRSLDVGITTGMRVRLR